MTTSRSVLLISLIALILAAFIPAVSALEVIYDEPITEYITRSKTGIQTIDTTNPTTDVSTRSVYLIGFKDITKAHDLKYIIIEYPGDVGYWRENHTKIQPGIYNDVTYRIADGSPRSASLVLERYTDSSGEVSKTVFTIRFRDWDIGSLTGEKYVAMSFDFDYRSGLPRTGTITSETNALVGWRLYDSWRPPTILPIKITEVSGIDWKHHLRVEKHSGTYYIVVNGFIDGQHFTSDVVLKKGAVIHSQYENPGERLELAVPASEINILEIISPSGTRYVYPLFGEGPYYPLRTVKVTMTDIDGNKISGFDVKAVNSYTGESYTVSTDSDVAYIALPMDRTARVPNPQTGEYEEAPVGYYLFYGYKPGYKMVPDWGIQVNVLPAKYMPDIFCDIIVAPVGSVPDDPNNSPVYVYVRNAQTGALLADATVIIKDTRTDPWTEVINQTVPSGQGTFYLAKDPANNPNQYFITALLPGYSDIYNGRHFHVTGPIYITVYMEPIEGGPSDENNTILEFYVRNPDGNPVSDAMVSVADQARWTNAQGWIRFEVPKNATYSYTVRKFGYVTIEGRVTVGDGPRHTVNVVLIPESIPTQPPGPGEPTPTQPPGGVPGDDGSEGFLSEAIRGISKVFGVGFATGKTILGMLLALAIGFATAKHLRGGAAEFGLGLLGGTMLGVLIGLLPVWTIVVLLLIVGMYIGYRYVGGGNNG